MTLINSTIFKCENAFFWALGLSLALHLALLIGLPKFDQEPLEQQKVLTVEFSQPSPVTEPAPKPEQIKPKVEPKPIPKIIPKQIRQAVVENKISQEQASEPTPVIAVEPKSEVQPVKTAPPAPVEPQKPLVNQEEIDQSRNQYGSLLSREIAKHKNYPKIAQMRGWQGDVSVDILIDGNGNVLSSKIHTSSGFESLDKQALEMVKKASPFPLPPAALRSKPFNVLVPVSFRLE